MRCLSRELMRFVLVGIKIGNEHHGGGGVRTETESAGELRIRREQHYYYY